MRRGVGFASSLSYPAAPNTRDPISPRAQSKTDLSKFFDSKSPILAAAVGHWLWRVGIERTSAGL
jgi:hypothetical protein